MRAARAGAVPEVRPAVVRGAGSAGTRVLAAVGGGGLPRTRGEPAVSERGEEGGGGADAGRAVEGVLLPHAVLWAMSDVSAAKRDETGREPTKNDNWRREGKERMEGMVD